MSATAEYITNSLAQDILFGTERPIRALVIGDLRAVMWEPRLLKKSTRFDFHLFKGYFALYTMSSEKYRTAVDIIDRPVRINGFGRFTLLRFEPGAKD